MSHYVLFLTVLASTFVIIVVSGDRFFEKYTTSPSKTWTANGDYVRKTHPNYETYTPVDPLWINTQYGTVRGTYSDGVRVFHGVPYGKPPIGELRWRPPVEPYPWYPEVFDARKIRPGCPQDCTVPIYCTNGTSEDCLFLEIYAPAKVTSLVPVMVFIHGGTFQADTATRPIYDATKFVKRAGTIVVLIEYRIGVLGFLVTGTGKDQATGNYGILDQRLALKWVKNNIKSFGGDPDRVTLAGQSAGAQSVLINLVSSESSRFFESFILESMPFTYPYQTSKVASERGRTFAQILNCLGKGSEVNIACLKTKTATEIIKAQRKSVLTDFSGTGSIEAYAPVVDGCVVKMQALDAWRKYAKTSTQIKPVIMSYTTEESLLFVPALQPNPVSLLETEAVLATYVGDLAAKVVQLYSFAGKNDTRDEITRALSDFTFRCPIKYSIKLLAHIRHSKEIWLYTWDRPIDFGYPQVLAACNERACHGTEVPFVFQSFSSLPNVTKLEDIQLSNSLITYYGNFIRNRNPNENKKHTPEITGKSRGLIYWPRAVTNKDEDISRLIFSRDGSLKAVTDVTDKYCDFWDSTGYPLLLV